jgi:hypothetical protein
MMTHKSELLLNRFFLPAAPNKATRDTWKDLSQPRLRSDAAAADYVLTKSLHLLFLTCQWKAPTGEQGLYGAQNQGARHGSAIVNHLFDLYSVANGHTPSVVDTATSQSRATCSMSRSGYTSVKACSITWNK